MRVIRSYLGYRQDPRRYLHFSDYARTCGDFVMLEGGFAKPLYWKEYNLTPQQLSKVKSKKVVRLDFAEPTNYFVGDFVEKYDDDFYKILTLCPYTAAWLNKKNVNRKRVPIFFPVNERYIPPKRKKLYDVIYSGHIVAQELKNELQELQPFRHVIISNSHDAIVTHRGVSYREKMKLYSQTRVAVVHNIIYTMRLKHRYANIWRIPDWRNNEAFKLIPPPWKPWELLRKDLYVPQLKSRVFEAAVTRTLILCRKDPFNVIERYFEPGKEFVYYEPGHLQETLADILAHYAKYERVIDRAFTRASREYTVKAFVKKYLQHI